MTSLHSALISHVDQLVVRYKPSEKLAGLCLPELSPIEYACLWSWHHPARARIHTLVVGAARPSDFDEAAAAAMLCDTVIGKAKVGVVGGRLACAMQIALGEEWAEGWWKHRLPSCFEVPDGTQVANIIWLGGLLKAWGMHEYCADRYQSFVRNRAKWPRNGERYDRDTGGSKGLRNGIGSNHTLTESVLSQQDAQHDNGAAAAKQRRQEAWRRKGNSGKSKGKGGGQTVLAKREREVRHFLPEPRSAADAALPQVRDSIGVGACARLRRPVAQTGGVAGAARAEERGGTVL